MDRSWWFTYCTETEVVVAESAAADSARLMGAVAAVSLMLARWTYACSLSVRKRTQESNQEAPGRQQSGARSFCGRPLICVGLSRWHRGALLLGRWLTLLVFEVSPSDPRIILATALVLTITGLLAAWLPARRASRVAPRIAMQES